MQATQFCRRRFEVAVPSVTAVEVLNGPSEFRGSSAGKNHGCSAPNLYDTSAKWSNLFFCSDRQCLVLLFIQELVNSVEEGYCRKRVCLNLPNFMQGSTSVSHEGGTRRTSTDPTTPSAHVTSRCRFLLVRKLTECVENQHADGENTTCSFFFFVSNLATSAVAVRMYFLPSNMWEGSLILL